MYDKDGHIVVPNMPEKGNDHLMDAIRYAMETLGRLKQEATYWDRVFQYELTGEPDRRYDDVNKLKFNKGK
jgi:hypothetical protein